MLQILQLRFDAMYASFSSARLEFEADGGAILAELESAYRGPQVRAPAPL